MPYESIGHPKKTRKLIYYKRAASSLANEPPRRGQTSFLVCCRRRITFTKIASIIDGKRISLLVSVGNRRNLYFFTRFRHLSTETRLNGLQRNRAYNRTRLLQQGTAIAEVSFDFQPVIALSQILRKYEKDCRRIILP